MKLRGARYVMAAACGACLAFLGLASGQQIHRDGFEGREPVWVKGAADAPSRETAHRLTDETAHNGKLSEAIHVQAEAGNYVFYTYDTARAPLLDELSVSVWVKANRPGVQLLARLVLPREPKDGKLDEPLTTLLPGDKYTLTNHWQRLEVRAPVKAAGQQQQMLRVQLRKDIDLAEAFVDQVVLNVYGGPGPTEVFVDDLEIGPVLDPSKFRPASRPDAKEPKGLSPAGPEVRWDRDQLTVGGKRFFFRAIRHTDTPLAVLREAGVNTVWLDEAATPAQAEEAAKLGLRVVPVLPVFTGNARLTANDALGQLVSAFPRPDAVLFWGLGSGGLTQEQQPAVARAAQAVRALDSRPTATDVWDGFLPYSRSVDLLGVHRWPLLTSLELAQYREWLVQRRHLAQPNTFLWTWVQTHLPDWYLDQAHPRNGVGGYDEPVGPQPEQVRLMTYLALASGCRGLGYWSDRFLADSHQGRDRLLEVALLNQELQLLEPLLTSAKAPAWLDTSLPDVKAAVFRVEKGLLVLPIWVGAGSQYVPAQGAATNLGMIVPDVPKGAQAWQVSPAGVVGLPSERTVGGTKVTLPEFDLTSAVVFTGDKDGLVVYFQEQARDMRRKAALWSRDLAKEVCDKVGRVEAELAKAGHQARNADDLMAKAKARLDQANQLLEANDEKGAYLEARRALRPLRVLMRAQWEEAVRGLDAPVASPLATSFYSLPKHWRYAESLGQKAAAANVLPYGDFELAPNQTPEGWTVQEAPTLDDVVTVAKRVPDEPREGRQCLTLQVHPKNPQQVPGALERTFLAINSPDVSLPPGADVQISGWVRIPAPLTASVDGAMIYDSAGDAPLAVRLTAPTGWKQFTLYRKVPPSGKIHVTLALTGLGAVYFDDIRIEPLVQKR